jgi:hypothetical protein
MPSTRTLLGYSSNLEMNGQYIGSVPYVDIKIAHGEDRVLIAVINPDIKH